MAALTATDWQRDAFYGFADLYEVKAGRAPEELSDDERLRGGKHIAQRAVAIVHKLFADHGVDEAFYPFSDAVCYSQKHEGIAFMLQFGGFTEGQRATLEPCFNDLKAAFGEDGVRIDAQNSMIFLSREAVVQAYANMAKVEAQMLWRAGEYRGR